MAEKKAYKVDIFALLGNIDIKNYEYFNSMTDEEKKSISPLILMKWMASTRDARQVYFLNELVNPLVFPFHTHKELLIKLMCACAGGKRQRYTWNKNTKKTTTTPKLVALVQKYYGYSSRDAKDALPCLSDESLLAYTQQLGYQPDEIKLIKKELKKRG